MPARPEMPRPWQSNAKRTEIEGTLRKHLELATSLVELCARELKAAHDYKDLASSDLLALASALQTALEVHRLALSDLQGLVN